jgi:hypothetical protein
LLRAAARRLALRSPPPGARLRYRTDDPHHRAGRRRLLAGRDRPHRGGALRAPRAPVVVDSRLGAGGRSAPDRRALNGGYTLLLGSKDTHGVMQHLYPGWDVDPVKDFAPISLLIRIQNTIVANPAVKASDMKELIALGKAENLNYGTPGVGTNLHLLAETLR